MREKTEKLMPCPISRSSNHDVYNDICRATGQPCPYYVDEGMSVCKSKIKCLLYFAKRWSSVKHKQVLKLIFSDTRPRTDVKTQYTNTLKRDKDMQVAQMDEMSHESDLFVEDLEAALKNYEVPIEESEEDT
ncbi:MAG: hypothetical protein IJA07_10135 [Agathobacter sp.]|nr:hypothetical protein [Agathobacter sp.]